MKTRTALFALLLACSDSVFAADPPAATVAEQADTQVQKIGSDTAKYLAELDGAIALAKSGQYGKLKRGSEQALADARQTIGNLLRDGVDPRQLKPEERIALFNAHQTIESILRKDDKSRMVCTREAEIGSRVTTTRCMTVGEREEQARAAQRSTDSVQRNVCTPGPGSACSK
jgi:hypothetical protein